MKTYERFFIGLLSWAVLTGILYRLEKLNIWVAIITCIIVLPIAYFFPTVKRAIVFKWNARKVKDVKEDGKKERREHWFVRAKGEPLSGAYIWIIAVAFTSLVFPGVAKIWFSMCLMETIGLIALGVIEAMFGKQRNEEPVPGAIRRIIVWLFRVLFLISISLHFLALKVDFVQPAVDKIDQWKSFNFSGEEIVEIMDEADFEELPEIEIGEWHELIYSPDPERWNRVIYLKRNQRWSYEASDKFRIKIGDRAQKLPAGEALIRTDRNGLLKIQTVDDEEDLIIRLKVDRIGPDPSRYQNFTCPPGVWTETVNMEEDDKFEFDTTVPIILKIGDGNEMTLGADGFLLKADTTGVLKLRPKSSRDTSEVQILIYE